MALREELEHGGREVRGLTRVVVLMALASCSKSEAPARAAQTKPAALESTAQAPDPKAAPSALAAARPDRSASNSTCSATLYAGFDSPEQAYTRYAEAINAGAWCEAINTFAREARDDMALGNFRALTVLAGSDNPSRQAYLERFRAFCDEYGLGCGSESDAAGLAQAILSGVAVDKELPALRPALSKQPEQTYVELMRAVAAVDPEATSQLATKLTDLKRNGDRASGKAVQLTGAASTLAFAKIGAGWLLTFEERGATK